MFTTKVRRIGNASGTTLPKSMLERLHLKDGDRIHIIETAEGLLITPYDPEYEADMEAYDVMAAKYRNAMQDLADS